MTFEDFMAIIRSDVMDYANIDGLDDLYVLELWLDIQKSSWQMGRNAL